MRYAASFASALWLLGAGAATAQAFPEGTFASDQESCAELEAKTPAELGGELDFQIVSKKGLIAFQQVCDFVSVVPHGTSSFVVTAFCDEAGYTYPDLFSIKVKSEERLNVTRLTDLTQGSSAADPGMTDEPESDEAASANGAPAGGEQAETQVDEQPAESYSSFVRCKSVKP